MIVNSDRWPISITITIEESDMYRERSKKTGKLGGPLMPTKNRARGASGAGSGTFTSKRQKHFRNLIAQACRGLDCSADAYSLRTLHVTPKGRRITLPSGRKTRPYPQPDADAILSAVRDAVQAREGFSGLVFDDAQITVNSASCGLNPDEPAQIHIALTRMLG